jgi:ABC-type transporter Mla subunit MlaD
MTPEERFNKIENLLQVMTGLQARHDEAIARHDAQIEKQNAGIQDLIRVSRTLLDSQAKTWDVIHALSEKLDVLTARVDTLTARVDALAVKVDTLTDNVNRFLAGLQKPNGSR